MKKLPFLFGFNKNKKRPVISIDDYKENLMKNGHEGLVDNQDAFSGGVLDGRSPEFLDITPNHTYRSFNNEFDMLP